MWNKLKIAISGKSGCGNTTVSKLLAKKLGLKHINYTFRNMAEQKRIPFNEFCRLVEIDFQYDLELDKKQVELASEPGCVLGSRLAIWLLKDADLKIYLYGSPQVRAERLAKRENQDFKIAYEDMMNRDEKDKKRYLELYNINIDKFNFADLIIYTEEYAPLEIIDIVCNYLKNNSLQIK